MCRQTVRREMSAWDGQATHRCFRVRHVIWRIPMHFTENICTICIRNRRIAGGMVPEVVPTFGPSKCSCAWGDAACIVPWNVYLFSGDAAILEQQFDSMKAWVDYIRKVDGEHHGWRHSFHYGDWLALDRVGAAAGKCMERPMKAILRIFIMRQARSLQRRQRRFSGERKRKNNIGKSPKNNGVW